MPKYYRVNLKDKENNIIYPNIHNEIQIEQNGTMKLKSLIPLYDNSYTLGNISKAWNNVYSYSLALDNQSGSWLDARDNNYGIYFKNQLTTTAYYQLFKMKTLNGHTITIGGIQNRFYIGSMKADRTENGTDNFFSFDANLGVFIFGGDVALRTGFYLPTYKGDNSWHLTQNNDKDFIGSYKTTGEYEWKFKISPNGALSLKNHISCHSTSDYRFFAGGGENYVWIDCRDNTNTMINNIILYPTHTTVKLTKTTQGFWIPKNSTQGYGICNMDGISIIRDYNNTNVTVDATGGDLYLGFQNTKNINFLNGKAKLDSNGIFTGCATSTGDGSLKIYAGHSNEVNFGGTGGQTAIHFGYRTYDSRGTITDYFFRGGSSAYANIVGKGITASGGLLYCTNNSNTVTIGSQNSSWCHIYNSANIPFYFNRTVYVNNGWYVVGSANSSARNIYILALSTWNSNYSSYAAGTIGFCY